MGVISWNNVSSDDLHVIVEHHPHFPIPERKMDVISVPGRSGDIIVTQDAYHNVNQSYDLAFVGLSETLPSEVRAVMEWLYSATGYARLEDSYNPAVFRSAYFKGGGDIENRFNTLGRATVEFICKPQRFLKDGEWPVDVSNGMKLSNPSVCTAKPIINIKGTGSATLTVGSSTLSISEIGTEIEIDCESQAAYRGSTNKNNVVTLTNGDFPQLKAGVTQISWNGSGVTGVVITPRWWIL